MLILPHFMILLRSAWTPACDCSSILPPEHWLWPTLFLLSDFFPDLTLFLSSSQFPVRTLLEYFGSIFHQASPSFCDAYFFVSPALPSVVVGTVLQVMWVKDYSVVQC